MNKNTLFDLKKKKKITLPSKLSKKSLQLIALNMPVTALAGQYAEGIFPY